MYFDSTGKVMTLIRDDDAAGNPKTLPLILILNREQMMEKVQQLGIRKVPKFAERLSEKARKIYQTPQKNTIIEYEENGERHIRPCVFFSKVVQHKEGTSIPEQYFDEMARMFNMLVDKGLLDFGVLAEAMIVPLARVEPTFERSLLVVYPFPSARVAKAAQLLGGGNEFSIDLEYKLLNVVLGDEAFAPEGSIGSDKW